MKRNRQSLFIKQRKMKAVRATHSYKTCESTIFILDRRYVTIFMTKCIVEITS